ncbi:MAG: DNA polymerase III subunit beta [Defluviitaleaceae bacterium]|nr:DNA polymerase III subunit beta [Defluviitaleaceae bacterium]
MVINCDKQQLQDALALVCRAVPTRTTNPILECVLLNADEESGIVLIGNDKEIYIESAAIPAQVEQGGSIALDARLFSDIVKKLTGDSVAIEVDERLNALCKSGRSRLKIAGQMGEEFPVVSENEIGSVTSRYKINAGVLKDMIKKTIFSVSLDQSKPILTGEKLVIKNNILEMVTIDMFRISYISADLGEAVDTEAVIPGRTLGELSRILSDDEEEINFYFTENKAVFESNNFRLVSNLLSGEFVRYDQIYNEDFSTMAVVERLPLLNAMERAILIASDSRMLPIKMDIKEDDITIWAETERGTVDDGIPCETDGKELVIYFNPKYFIEMLRALDDERIVLKLNTPLSPCTIHGMEQDNKYRYLIVPLRPPA